MLKKNKSYLQLSKILSSQGIGSRLEIKFKKIVGINLRSNENYNVKSRAVNKINKLSENNYLVGRKLLLNKKENLEFLTKSKTYRGLRNKFGYPARGQRTHTNAKTKKKLQK